MWETNKKKSLKIRAKIGRKNELPIRKRGRKEPEKEEIYQKRGKLWGHMVLKTFQKSN